MRRETQDAFQAMLIMMAESYGVTNPHEAFTATEPMAQAFNDAIQETSGFLQEISVIPVVDIKGELVTMEIPSTVAKRTAVTSVNGREPIVLGAFSDRNYECKFTEFDVSIAYALMDAWARYGNLHTRYMKAIYRRIALDRILIGWHGTSAAAATDNVANPSLQDVNMGWIHDLKTNNPAHYLLEGATAGKIQIGAAGDYKNIHQFVYDIGSLIKDEYRTGREVAIMGRGLVAHDMNQVLGTHGETPTEGLHFDVLGKSYGGYKSVFVPGFPELGLMVTDPKNLQIYLQASSLRRKNEDQPKFNRIVDFISQNEAYMIGELNAVAGVEAGNVEIL